MENEPLSAAQLRVIGALIEKAATVPDTYPMTLKGLLTACNQQNNRDPVTAYDESTVLRTLDELKALGLVRFVHPSHGARSTKYRQVFAEAYGLETAEEALLAILMLRGPCTVNELRVRTERYHPFAHNDEVDASLAGLAARHDPLVVLLPRQPGQKEARWMHLLAGPVEDSEHPPAVPPQTAHEPPPPAAPAPPSAVLEARVHALEQRVAALEAVLADAGVPPSSATETGAADAPDDSGA